MRAFLTLIAAVLVSLRTWSRKRNWLGRDLDFLPAQVRFKEHAPPLVELGAATDVAAVIEASDRTRCPSFLLPCSQPPPWI
jgi:hypothetical protein